MYCACEILILMASIMAAAKELVAELRLTKFTKGNTLRADISQAVKYLSSELYVKDVHFLMELIQVFV